MDLSLASGTLLSAPVLAFALGALTVALRSDLRMPPQLTTSLSLYLLLAIGLKGGVALRESEPSQMAIPLAVGLILGVTIPLAVFAILRLVTPYGAAERGAIAAHYGSTSLVTFTAATASLTALAIDVPAYAYALLTALEIPGIIVGLILAHRTHGARAWRHTLRELVTGTSIVLLAGGLVMGAILGADGYAPIAPVFSDAFKGILVLFLIGLGMKAAQGINGLRRGGAGLVAFAALWPLAIVTTVTALGAALGLGVGGAVVLGIVSASASYIAAPAAVRVALPDVNLAIPLTASLSVTFPVNLLIGIPVSIALARTLAG